VNLRITLFLAMALAGILTIALIVTADESYAGIDGLRAIRAFVGQKDGETVDVTRIPFLGGIASAIHDVAPQLFDPAPPSPPDAAVASPSAASSPQPIDPPGAPVALAPSAAPTARPSPPDPVSTTTPAPSSSPAPSTTAPPASAPPVTPAPTAPPSATPAPTPTPSPSPTAAPTLAVSTDRGATAIVTLADLVPGDSLDRTVTVRNDGTLPFRYTVAASQAAATLLWTDSTHGLQLTVRTAGGAVLYSGALSGLGVLAGPTILSPGGTETLRYTFDFPATASNAFQGLVQDLALVFDAVEYP